MVLEAKATPQDAARQRGRRLLRVFRCQRRRIVKIFAAILILYLVHFVQIAYLMHSKRLLEDQAGYETAVRRMQAMRARMSNGTTAWQQTNRTVWHTPIYPRRKNGTAANKNYTAAILHLMEQQKPKTLATAQQMNNLLLQSRTQRFERALMNMQDDDLRYEADPLNEKYFVEPTPSNRLKHQPKVKYLGVLVDAGRHYFPIPWLERLIKYLYRLRFNMIQFRLTDDQSFNLQLKSYPQLALASAAESTNATYTPQQLRHLVEFARRYNITLFPEINVPGHTGAWTGIPGMVLECPRFACKTGYGIPLNVHYPEIKTVLKAVIQEVIEIFDNPPFLHLGGDEVHKSHLCFEELGLKPFQYDCFEQQLTEILEEIGYPQENVIRWEVTGPDAAIANYRAGKIQQNWYYLPGEKLELNPNHTYFNSWKLYMDANDNDGAPQIFAHTVNNFQQHLDGTDHLPAAIIPGAFELDVELWSQRNVAARLLAVALATAHLEVTNTQFRKGEKAYELYEEACHDLILHPVLCDLQGFTAVPNTVYRANWRKVWQTWINGTCSRMQSLVA